MTLKRLLNLEDYWVSKKISLITPKMIKVLHNLKLDSTGFVLS